MGKKTVIVEGSLCDLEEIFETTQRSHPAGYLLQVKQLPYSEAEINQILFIERGYGALHFEVFDWGRFEVSFAKGGTLEERSSLVEWLDEQVRKLD